ncbi:hypothetical protein [Maritalea mediterranea]|uniref:VWFA domain-containing protein n=1 Tax=Maritalea mediterranea TaxID=2909667 RepID=A0ABS9E673_9HYPH|nr:hypothetical protein [Maritalea mediterranea]MCF4097749.1 hypothetical protein [Maritalea mediterranea]
MLLLAKLLKRFHRDESGAFAVIFGVMTIVLIATGGSAVDFVNIQQSRATAQISLDAAALALQPKIHTHSKAAIKDAAAKLLDEAIANPSVTATMLDPEIDKEAGSLFLSARISRPTFFVRFIGIDKMEALIEAEATRARNRLEVSLVLDNSGSMRGTKIKRLREAAALAVDVISEYQDKPEKVFFGLVPFADMVKVDPSNRYSGWMDTAGVSSISWDNFDDDDDESTGHDISDPAQRLSRFDLYDAMPDVDWAGCVEARPHNKSLPFAERLDVYDKGTTMADGDTYIVPLFQPDTPDDTRYRFDYLEDNPPSCPTEVIGECRYRYWNGRNRNPSGWESHHFPTYGYDRMPNNTCTCEDKTITKQSSHWGGSKRGTIYVQWCDATKFESLSLRERQERICKYDGAKPKKLGYKSPNGSCTVDPVIPLTNDMKDVKKSIKSMDAEGGTNIHMGAMWGLRVLSPQPPFSEGDDYGRGTSKVMIVMTDGQNTAYPSGDKFNNTYYYSMYGFHYNERMGDLNSNSRQIRDEMNRRTLQVCTNAKADGIEVYTIGLGVSAGSSNGAMLTDCASGDSRAYFPSDPDELEGVFLAIADQLSDLRISK